MKMKHFLVGAGMIALATHGCTTPAYYKVTDISTSKVYYTDDMYQEHGIMHLKDGKTGDAVTLQNSEVRNISKEEFEAKSAEP